MFALDISSRYVRPAAVLSEDMIEQTFQTELCFCNKKLFGNTQEINISLDSLLGEMFNGYDFLPQNNDLSKQLI